jgi:hypothetical protein
MTHFESAQTSIDISYNKLLESDTGIQPIPIEVGEYLKRSVVARVEDFPSPGSEGDDEKAIPVAMQYPGRRPDSSYSVFESQVTPGELLTRSPSFAVDNIEMGETPAFYVKVNSSNDKDSLKSFTFNKDLIFNIDDLLTIFEAVPMRDRYPVIAFGSNANPGQLAQKFKDLEAADKNIVPTLRASVKGMVPVYVSRIGLKGYVFTDLFPTDDAEAECEVYVNFLSPAQLETMDSTEKSYSLCEVPNLCIKSSSGNNLVTNAYLYAGKVEEEENDAKGAGILADENGRPIRLAELSASGERIDEEFAAMTQPQVQEYIYGIAGSQIADYLRLESTPDDEIDIARMIITRKNDNRLSEFRREAKAKAEAKGAKFLLGRAINEAIQEAIKTSGRTIPEKSIRVRIPKEMQDLSLDGLKNFSQLNT